jgi:hypothetical protein
MRKTSSEHKTTTSTNSDGNKRSSPQRLACHRGNDRSRGECRTFRKHTGRRNEVVTGVKIDIIYRRVFLNEKLLLVSLQNEQTLFFCQTLRLEHA